MTSLSGPGTIWRQTHCEKAGAEYMCRTRHGRRFGEGLMLVGMRGEKSGSWERRQAGDRVVNEVDPKDVRHGL